jgi:hypothetical protein
MEVTRDSIDQFYKDVEKLGLKFPVAAITKGTGYSKGNVSAYLSKKMEPSANFLKKFYEVFSKGSKNVPSETLTETAIIEIAQSNNKLADAQKDLTESNKILAINIDRLVSANLGVQIKAEGGRERLSEQEAWLIETVSSLDSRKVKQLADFLNKLRVEKTGKSLDGRK